VTKLDRGTCQRCTLKATPIMLTSVIQEDRRITVSEVAEMLDVNSFSAYVTVVPIYFFCG
jgi:hypothetical protein